MGRARAKAGKPALEGRGGGGAVDRPRRAMVCCPLRSDHSGRPESPLEASHPLARPTDRKGPVFEALTDRLQGVIRNLTGQGRLSPDNVRESLREVRRALLEADVQLGVARDF